MKAEVIDFTKRHVLATRPIRQRVFITKEYRIVHGRHIVGKFCSPAIAVEAARFAAAETAGRDSKDLGKITVVLEVQKVAADEAGQEVIMPHVTVRYTAGSYLPRIEDPQPTTARPQAPSA